MILSRLTPAVRFTVFNPRWHDRKALLMDFRIGTHNEITFPKANSLPGSYYISGKQANTYPTTQMKTKTGQHVTMRVVPLDELESLERE